MKQLIDYVRSSIKRKMILITITIILFVLFTISFFTINETSRTIKDDVQRYSTQILEQANLNLNRYFVEYEQGFLSMGVSDEFQEWLNINEGNKAEMIIKFGELQDQYIRSLTLRHPEILSVTILNSNGNEMYYTGSRGFDMLCSLKDELTELECIPLNKTEINVVDTDYYRDSNGRVEQRVISLTRGFIGRRDYSRGYIKADLSLTPMNDILGDIYLGKEGYVLLVNTDGSVITGTGAGKDIQKLDDHLLSRVQDAASGSFFLAGVDDLVMYAVIPYTQWITIAVVPYEDVAGSIIHLRGVTLWVTLISLIAAMLLIVLFASSITRRLVKLRASIKQVQKGNLSGVVAVDGTDEVSDLSRAYNRMLTNLNDTIHDLAETRVSQQEAILSALQSQINSHFLYNTLESINSMASLANHKDIERVTIALSNMLRYTADYKKAVVKVEDEIRHLVNYMEIIQVRYGGMVTYDLTVQEGCREAECLKVIIQPLVENSIKHGIESTGKPIHISMQVEMIDEKYMRIRIKDNGSGFDQDKLLMLQEKLASKETDTGCGKASHIGLLNVQHRVRMFYKDEKTGIQINNDQKSLGAVVEIICPIQYRKPGR